MLLSLRTTKSTVRGKLFSSETAVSCSMCKKLCPLACSILSPGCRAEAAGPSCCTHVGGFEGVPLAADATRDTETETRVLLYSHAQLLLKTIRALLAFSLQQAASALRPWVGVGGHNDLVAMAHALVDMVLRIGSGLMGGVRGMGVVLGLVSGLGQGHRQATAGVGLSRGLRHVALILSRPPRRNH